MSKRAVILAGGEGRRLRPYTVVIPKPLMPIGKYPVLEVIVRQLVSCGFDHITMAVNHQAEIIKAFFNSGEKWGVRIDYSLENKPLGTMGPLKLIRDLKGHFLVMNGDVLTDLNFVKFYDYHVEKNHFFTVSTCKRELRSEFGVLEINKNGLLSKFQEKPIFKFDVSMGIYMLSKEALEYIPHGQAYGFDQLMMHLIESNIPVHGKQHQGFWLDIGRPDDYLEAQEVFEQNSSMFLKVEV